MYAVSVTSTQYFCEPKAAPKKSLTKNKMYITGSTKNEQLAEALK